MKFTLKPTRMTISDQRPSLSYRVGLERSGRGAQHWVEIVLASGPELFDPANVTARTPRTFVTFAQRFAMPGDDAIVQIPPAALLPLASAERIHVGAALFAERTGGAPLAVIRPDPASVYVDATGFTGAGLRWRFGFTGRPGVSGEPPLNDRAGETAQPIAWSGDGPAPGTAPPPQHGQPPIGAGAQAEGQIPMPQNQGFMHKGGYAPAMPQQPAPAQNSNGNGAAGPGPQVDYDDGYGTPPPLPPQRQMQPNGQGHQPGFANGSPNGGAPMPPQGAFPPSPGHVPPGGAQPQPMPVMPGNGTQAVPMPVAPTQPNGAVPMPPQGAFPPSPGHVLPGGAQPQPMPVMPGNGTQAVPMPVAPTQPNGAVPMPVAPIAPMPGAGSSAGQAPQAAQQGFRGYATPMEFVLPSGSGWTPWDVINTVIEGFRSYRNFTAGVPDTSKFPFSSIVAIRSVRRRKSDNAAYYFGGTGFYIGPNLLLTCAHNFAENSEWHATDTAELYAGLNGPGSNNPADGTYQSVETINGSSAVIHPTYFNGATSEERKSHDLAVVRASNPAPHGLYFRIADFTPSQEVPIAVCGYGRSSHAQGSDSSNWRQLLPAVERDWNQHMDSDVIGGVVANGEAFIYNAQTLGGTSGSPVFTEPNATGNDPTAAMQVIAVHTRGYDDTHNYGVRLTPNKRDWALAGGQVSVQQSYGGYAAQASYAYAEPMLTPETWAAIGTAVGAAASAGVMGMQASTGDISWKIQRMVGWKAQGQHPVPEIPVPENTLQTSRRIELNSPYYSSTLGDMFANFSMTFQYDGTGVGGLMVDATPSTGDNVGGGLKVDMQIVPLSESFPSRAASGTQVACVELRIFYTFEWTISDSDLVVVTYRFYGDGTYESNVRGGQQSLGEVPATYSDYRR